MTEQEIAEGWKQANIARVLDAMRQYNLTLADLIDPGDNKPMGNIAVTSNPEPAARNTVAGQ